MSETETIMILAVLKAAYPHAYKGMKKADGEAMVKLWHMQMASDSFEEVQAAVHSLIATRTEGYSPTIGEVKEQIAKLHRSKELSESAAWSLVSKACSNGLYGYREEFAKLPPEVQNVVGSPEQLKEWAAMDAETVQSVVASNFMRNYRVTQQRAKETAMLPQNVKQFIAGVTDSMKMLTE